MERHPKIENMLRKQRKSNRETLELKKLLAKAKSHVEPDAKIIKMIQEEIDRVEDRATPPPRDKKGPPPKAEGLFISTTENTMRPLKRKPINKYKSAKKFRKQTRTTKAANLKGGLQRGGWRL